MSTSIQCPHCSAVLNIKDPSVLGKKLRCPKCRQVFASTKVPVKETPAFASLDFEDKPRDIDDALGDMLGETPYEFADSGAPLRYGLRRFAKYQWSNSPNQLYLQKKSPGVDRGAISSC